MPRVQNQDTTQRDQALANANAIRMGRAGIKRAIKEGMLSPLEVLQEPSEYAVGMRVSDVLAAVPMIGRKTAEQVLEGLRISDKAKIKDVPAWKIRLLDEKLSEDRPWTRPWCRALSRPAHLRTS